MTEPKPDLYDENATSKGMLRATIILGRPEPTDAQTEILETLLASRPGWVLETIGDEWPPDELARAALEAGAEMLVAAGGDGTVSAVAGVLAAAESEVPMAILPFGTANDFARTIGVLAMDEALAALDAADEHAMDIIRVRSVDGDERFVLNVANGGLAWDIGDSLDGEKKGRWGALAYARGALDVLASRVVHQVAIQVDEEPAQRREVLTVAVSSGRTCGGGLMIAPTADPEDGVLEVTLLGDVPPATAAALATRMRLGAVPVDDSLERFLGKQVTIDSDPPMRFVLDGELVPESQVTFSIVPNAVRIWVGAGYRREPSIPD
ncbi:MAG: hypothetical protein JJ863_23055 [Deltaproteobacteria bacterium]|nr:hypothetical protein [Deltaproteobacteria bacterium]